MKASSAPLREILLKDHINGEHVNLDVCLPEPVPQWVNAMGKEGKRRAYVVNQEMVVVDFLSASVTLGVEFEPATKEFFDKDKVYPCFAFHTLPSFPELRKESVIVKTPDAYKKVLQDTIVAFDNRRGPKRKEPRQGWIIKVEDDDEYLYVVLDWNHDHTRALLGKTRSDSDLRGREVVNFVGLYTAKVTEASIGGKSFKKTGGFVAAEWLKILGIM